MRTFHTENDRIQVKVLGSGFYSLSICYGFKDNPNIPAALRAIKEIPISLELMTTSFFLSRQTLIPKLGKGMVLWREHLFALMYRNAGSATVFFKIPANRVIELGTRIEF